jgi:hypothetical protein
MHPHLNPAASQDLASAWKGIVGDHLASHEAPQRSSLKTRLRRFAIAMIDTTRDLVSGEQSSTPPSLRPPYSYTSPYGTQIHQGHVHSHVAPPSYPVPVQTMREVLPVNSVAFLCPDCKIKHKVDGHGNAHSPLPYKVKPGERLLIHARPQRVAFRPERISIENADRWLVHDFKIGNRSQFAQSGSIPGSFFDARNTDAGLSFETAQTAMDVTFDVTYLGPEEAGEQFLATVAGTAAV